MLRRFPLAAATILICATHALAGERLSLSCTPVNESGPNPVRRIEAFYNGERFSVVHIAANGERIDRSDQYSVHVRSKSDPLSWEGTNRRRPHLMMVGKILPSGESYQYVEQLFDARQGGEKTYETRANCVIRGASLKAPPTGAETPVPAPAEAPAQNTGKAVASRTSNCQSIIEAQQRLACYDTQYPPAQKAAEEAQATKTPVPEASKLAVGNLTESDLETMRGTYDKNQARFARDYVGRNFEASLQIDKITRNATARNRFDVSLERGIVCATEDEKVISFITNLNKGDKVHVTGVVHDITAGNLELNQCQVGAGD